jgi:hypothetical protein
MIESVSPAFRPGISGFPALLAVLLVLICTSIHASENIPVKLNWSPTPKSIPVITDKTIVQPTFTNASHTQKFDLLPVYIQSVPATSDSVTVQIVNPVFSAAGKLDAGSTPFLQPNVQTSAHVTYYHKQPKAVISVLPFRKNPVTGAVEKLESFTLSITFIPKPQLRSLNSYAANSVLSSGTWFKLSVNAAGMYVIDYNFIKKTLGLNPSSVNLKTLAIFGNGGGMVPDQVSIARPDDLLENPTLMVDANNNGQFDQGDYLLFYAQMADQWLLNTTTNSFYHQKNLYTDVNYYFLTTDAGTGKRVQTTTATGSPTITINDFDEHLYHDSDIVNFLNSGKEWFGEEMTSFNTAWSYSFSCPNIESAYPVTLNAAIGVNSTYSSVTTFTANGQNLLNINDGGITPSEYQLAYQSHNSSATFNTSSGQINIGANFQVSSDPTGTAGSYIDWIELLFKRQLSLSGSAMNFRNIAATGAGKVCNFILSNANSSTVVWDVSNPGSIQQMQSSLSGSQLSFAANTDQLREFIGFNSGPSFPNPTYVGTVGTQNLHATGQPNMVIVAYDDFVSAANDLANFHRSNDNISVTVAPLSQVYNEFGSGKPDISAIRDFMVMLYNRAGNDTTLMPRYLCLLGDGSFDPKARSSNTNNYVNVYESYNSNDPLSSYVSDDFFGLLDPGDGGAIDGGTQTLDVSVGRIAATSETEAEAVVNKIKNYKKLTPTCTTCATVATNNSWRNVLTFVADYLYNFGQVFEEASDGLAEQTRALYPVYNYNKIYTDAYKIEPTPAGDRFPDVNTAIVNQLNSGTLIMNWVGHGNSTTWSNGRIFTFQTAEGLANQYLPLFITATCEFSCYDQPGICSGVELQVNSGGGAVALISTVRLVFESSNETINNAVFKYLFTSYQGRYATLGEVTRFSKNDAVMTDQTNTRKFTLLGDPALTLNYPKYNINTTFVDNKPISAPHDTLKALTQITIKGQVTDASNNKLTTFNGTVYPLVYDKIAQLVTLNNDNLGSVFGFQEYTNVLFKGTASVNNGDFSFKFIVPKDINYQYGNGRISYYADNGSNLDAHGYTNSIIVGGSADTAHISTIGPKVSLYMDDTKFVDGGTTNTSPLLLAELQDAGGINTSGNGVGHNLTAVLDNNNQNLIILNDFYQSALNDFTKGEIRYQFSNLAPGAHNVHVRAWDIYNNSTDAYIDFVVTNSTGLTLNHVYNYPNPFTTHTEFMFEENIPCDNFDVGIQIYSVSGKLVKSIVQQVQSVGYRVDGIEWNGLDDYGSPIGKGVYVYKLSVRDANGNSAHKFEKLVILR